jgi:hypothetical protein
MLISSRTETRTLVTAFRRVLGRLDMVRRARHGAASANRNTKYRTNDRADAPLMEIRAGAR